MGCEASPLYSLLQKSLFKVRAELSNHVEIMQPSSSYCLLDMRLVTSCTSLVNRANVVLLFDGVVRFSVLADRPLAIQL
jgi:hypothetical protein